MLGSDFDVSLGVAPADLATAASTGNRVFMGGVSSVLVLFVGAAGAAAEPPVLTLRSHTALTGGTSGDMATITEYWTKNEATLDGDEQWVRSTQSAAATVTGTAQVQQLIAFQVKPEQLASGRKYISVNVADVGIGAQPGTVLYVLNGLSDRGTPVSQLPPLR